MQIKTSESFEGPYLIDQDYKPSIKMDNYPSLGGLQRENNFLGTLTKEDVEYNFWLSKGGGVAEVTTEATDDIGQKRQLVVVKLRFNSRADLPIDKELQVDTVYTHENFRKTGLAVAMYVLLARYGYSVVSDFSQYRGGKALWKKLAGESSARNYVVRVWDDETGDWVKNQEGEIVKYNAQNLDDENIWKDISKHHESTTLLVLTSK